MGQLGQWPWVPSTPLYPEFLPVIASACSYWPSPTRSAEPCIDLYFIFTLSFWTTSPLPDPGPGSAWGHITEGPPWLFTLLHKLINSYHWLKVKLPKISLVKSLSLFKSVSFWYIFAFVLGNKSSNPKRKWRFTMFPNRRALRAMGTLALLGNVISAFFSKCLHSNSVSSWFLFLP